MRLFVTIWVFIFQSLALGLIMYHPHLRSWSSHCKKAKVRFLSENFRFAKSRCGLAANSAEALPPITFSRSMKVILPSIEGVDLDSLTDSILENCPHVLSVSVELVKEKTNMQGHMQCYQFDHDLASTAKSDFFRAWESHVQGTSAWIAALVRLHVAPAFQTGSLRQFLLSSYPSLPHTISEPVVEETEIDWMLKVQQSWPPQRIGNLSVYFPWHKRSSCAEQNVI